MPGKQKSTNTDMVKQNINSLFVYCKIVLKNFERANNDQVDLAMLLESLDSLHSQIYKILKDKDVEQQTFLIFYTELFKQLYISKLLIEPLREVAQFVANLHAKIRSIADDPYEVAEQLPDDIKEVIKNNNKLSPYDFVMRTMAGLTSILNYLFPAILRVAEGNVMQRFKRTRNYARLIENANPGKIINIPITYLAKLAGSAQVGKKKELILLELDNYKVCFDPFDDDINFNRIKKLFGYYIEHLNSLNDIKEDKNPHVYINELNEKLKILTNIIISWQKQLEMHCYYYAFASLLLDKLNGEFHNIRLLVAQEFKKNLVPKPVYSSTAKLINELKVSVLPLTTIEILEIKAAETEINTVQIPGQDVKNPDIIEHRHIASPHL